MFSAIRTRLTPRSVSARLTFWYLLTLGVSLAGFAVFVFIVRAHALYQELDASLDVRSHQLASDLRLHLLLLDVREALADDPSALTADFLVRHASGPILFQSPGFPALPWDSERTLMARARTHGSIVTVRDRQGLRYRVETIAVARPGTDDLAVQIAASTAGVRRTLLQSAGVLAMAILIVLIGASYGSGYTARRALAPIDAIVARARAIEAHHPGGRLDVQGGSEELDRLISTLNGMLERIDISTRGARRFAGDASHELQTPLAAMRNAVDTCLRGAHGPAEYEEMAAGVLAEIDRLSAMIRDLRLLALADAGHLLDEQQDVDLAAVTLECGEIARAIGDEKRIRVHTAVDPIHVRGSALHLRRAILNLTQNAIRYSPASADIDVLLRHRDGQAVLSVADHGCGIPASDLPHIFEPFYRADPARARDTGGSGLGLAIADQIVRAHGGRIAVTSTPGRGTVFTMYLPALAIREF